MKFKNSVLYKNFEEFTDILDNMYDEILIYDNKYNIVYTNKACQRHYDCQPEDMIGKSFFDYINKDKNSWDCSILPIIYQEKKPYAIKQKTTSNSELFTIAVPIFDEKNNLKYVVMNVRDNVKEVPLFNPDYTYQDSILKKVVKPMTDNLEMQEVLKMAERISKINATCIITGESGTGKTMLAKYIHSIGTRQDGPFVSLNCASIPPNLIESELFGYERGAFTGANINGKKGLFEVANKGTLLLDEISELPLSAQAKLLHVLQEQKFLPIGGNKEIKVDVRIIAATNKNLKLLINNKLFREDLYYRLNVIELYLPPLRDRKEDIQNLISIFLNKFNQKYNFSKKISKEAIEILKNAKWKGNIRELQHVIERCVVTNDDNIIDIRHLPENISGILTSEAAPITNISSSFDEKISKYEEKIIKDAFEKCGSSRKVAEFLKISQTKANNLIRKYIPKK